MDITDQFLRTKTADWRQRPARTVDRWIVGADLGKSIDSTAISVLHHTITASENWRSDAAARTWQQESVQRFDLVHLQRLPLGMNYVTQARAIGEILQREPLKSANADLVVDQSGVGAGVVDLMESNGLRPIRIQITAGTEVSRREGGNGWNVAKSALISTLEAAMHSGELHVAGSLTEAETLREELRDFQRHVTASGANTWSARAGAHDDIVLATSYTVWWAIERTRNTVTHEPLRI
jgi:hypothetical protein